MELSLKITELSQVIRFLHEETEAQGRTALPWSYNLKEEARMTFLRPWARHG